MKYTTIIGILLIGIGIAFYYIMNPIAANKELLFGTIIGLGIGFFVGGILGWMYKKRTIVKQVKPSAMTSKTQESLKKEDTSGENFSETNNF